MRNDFVHMLALSMIPGVGDLIAKILIESCGSAEAVFSMKSKSLLEIPGVGKVLAKSIVDHKPLIQSAEDQIPFIEKYNISVLTYNDENYPKRLLQCDDGPLFLFYKGNTNLNTQKVVGVVGTRKCTNYGQMITASLIEDLAAQNVLVVSGLAYGIDICAHKNALQNNLDTVGVLAHGLDTIYPAKHRKEAEEMIHQGGLLTEFLPGTRPDKENFPKRNRIVAGMCDAVVVVESSAKGGSLITADLAHGYNREVFVYPGRTNDQQSAGCNALIKSDKAQMIENGDELIQFMQWNSSKRKPTQLNLFEGLTEVQSQICKYLQQDLNPNIELLSAKVNMNLPDLQSELFELEMDGKVKSLPGNRVMLTC